MGILDRLRGGVFEGDKALLRHMRSAGQQLDTIPRETEHHLLFERESDAIAAADKARGLGFAAAVDGEGRNWVVNATHTILVNETTITRARRTLTSLAAECRGEYDGWDTFSDEAIARQRAKSSGSRSGAG